MPEYPVSCATEQREVVPLLQNPADADVCMSDEELNASRMAHDPGRIAKMSYMSYNPVEVKTRPIQEPHRVKGKVGKVVDRFSGILSIPFVFTARCYASAVLAMGLCLSVCLSASLSQVGVLLKQLNVGSHKQHHTITQGLWFSDAEDLHEIRSGSPPTRAPNAGGVGQNRRLSTNNRLYLENGKR